MADLVVDTTSYAFGMSVVGTPGGSHAFTFMNQGDGPAPPLFARIAGTGAPAFAVESNTCLDPLQAGAACTVTVDFNPTSTGTLAAQLSFGPDFGLKAAVDLHGAGRGQAKLTIQGTNFDFGSVALTSSTALPFLIVNTGDADSGTLTVRIAESDGAAISLKNDGCTGRALGPNMFCTLSVAFAPGAAGGQSALLVAAASPGGTALADLGGRGIAGAIGVIVPASYTFETIANTTSAGAIFTFTNAGALPAPALSPSALVGPNASEFQFLSDSCSGRALMPGDVCMVAVNFAPTTIGTKNAQIQISGFPDGVHTAMLIGISRAAVPISLVPLTFDFASAPTSLSGGPVSFTVSNPNATQSAQLVTTLAGTNAAEFQIQSDGCTGIALAPESSCNVSLIFMPSTAGPKSATLTVTPMGGTGVTSVVSANAVMPSASLALSTYAYGFGVQPLRSTSTFPLFLRNQSAVPTGPVSITVNGSPAFSVVNDGCSGSALGSVCSFSLQFAPTAPGDFTATVIASATPGGSVSARIGGSSVSSFPVRVLVTGQGMVTGPEIGCPGVCATSFDDGSIVNLTPSPSPGSVFAGWSGACTGVGACTLHVDRAENVSATFVPANASLAIQIQGSAGASGTVVGRAGGIDCPPLCRSEIAPNTRVTLTASAAFGYAFAGWSGPCVGLEPTCTIVPAGSSTITASFVPYNLIFATDPIRSPAQLGGAAGADRICTATATTAHLPGTYVAWISTSSVSAIDRLARLPSVPRGWARPDGKPFADSLSALAHGVTLFPPLASVGAVTSTAAEVITGTGGDGGFIPGLACGDWREASGVFLFGRMSAGGDGWTASGAKPCSATMMRLYCMGIDHAALLPAPPRAGRLAFVSDHVFEPASGIPEADNLCNTEARTARIPGRFRALLASSSSSALSRFDLTKGPWTRTDGIPFVAAATDLMTRPLSALAVRANGRPAERGLVWTGIATDAASPSSARFTCNDWSSGMDLDTGSLGYDVETDAAAWDVYLVASCHTHARVYCLQD